MRLRYLFFAFVFVSLFMHSTWRYLIPYCETTSQYWFLANNREWKTKTKILILGDSQIVSGLRPETIAEIEQVRLDEVLYLPKPSQQPEGIYSDTLLALQKLSNLRKVYVNLSPLNTSKNSITDAHKQAYVSFSPFQTIDFRDPLLRKVYYSSVTDLIWKMVIQIFPYFGLSSNLNRIFYDRSVQSDLDKRQLEWENIQRSMEKESGAWIWKSIDSDPKITKDEKFQNLDTKILAGKRDISIELWTQSIQTWKQKNWEVVILRIPFSPQMERDLKEKHANLVSEIFLDQIQKESNSGQVKIFDFKESFVNEYQYFADLTHLNRKGRDVFANLLKEKLLNHTHTSTKSM